jgi:hypothetical protein
MPKFRLALAMPFLIGGIVVGFGFSLLETLGNMEAGMSATSVHGGPSIEPLEICVEAFFGLGIAACLPISLLARRVMAASAYLSLFFAILYLHYIGVPLINLGNLVILLIAFFYLAFWASLIFLEN